MNESPPLVSASGIHKSFHDGSRELQVLRGANLTLDRGESVALLGRSGSGKSTFLHILGLLDRANSGSYSFAGQEVASLGESGRNQLRANELGFVFQNFHLLQELSALENVLLPLRLTGRTDRHSRARELLEAVGLGDRLRHRPGRLSGGEQQRVAIARAWANQPSLLLCDEPTGNLDRATAEQVLQGLFRLAEAHNTALILVTHDPELAARTQRRFHLEEGLLKPA